MLRECPLRSLQSTTKAHSNHLCRFDLFTPPALALRAEARDFPQLVLATQPGPLPGATQVLQILAQFILFRSQGLSLFPNDSKL